MKIGRMDRLDLAGEEWDIIVAIANANWRDIFSLRRNGDALRSSCSHGPSFNISLCNLLANADQRRAT